MIPNQQVIDRVCFPFIKHWLYGDRGEDEDCTNPKTLVLTSLEGLVIVKDPIGGNKTGVNRFDSECLQPGDCNFNDKTDC